MDYLRTRSAPPQESKVEKAAVASKFKLINDDGTPFSFDSEESLEDRSEDQEVDKRVIESAIGNVFENAIKREANKSAFSDAFQKVSENVFGNSIIIEETIIIENPIESPIIIEEISQRAQKIEKPIFDQSTESKSKSKINETDRKSIRKQKEYFTKKIKEASSNEEDIISEFERFIQLEAFMREFPAKNEICIKSKIKEFFAIRERCIVDFKLSLNKKETGLSVSDKLRALKEKEDTSLEQIRTEFNRVTVLNVNDVIESLLKIKVEKIEEMKGIAAFVFEKAINEPVFLKVYLQIIGRLKKDWKCTEEMQLKDKIQTCFFGTIIKYTLKKIESKQNWGTQVDVSTIKDTDRNTFELKLEELESERLYKKKQSIGAISLLIGLYSSSIVGPSNMITSINTLTANKCPENVEMLCLVVKELNQQLVFADRGDQLDKMLTYLSKNEGLHGQRCDYLIESTIKNSLKVKKVAAQKSQNTFSGFCDIKEDSEPAEVKKSETVLANEFVEGIVYKIGQIAGESDVSLIYSEFEKTKQISPSKIFTAFLIEAIINHKIGSQMVDIFLKRLICLVPGIFEILCNIKEELFVLAIDFPIAFKKFSELICLLRAADYISAEEFEKMKPQEFIKNAAEFLKKWKATGDPRIKIVLTPAEINSI